VIVFEPALIAPLNIVAPRLEGPAVKLVVKRLVELAVVLKKLVEVALVVVELPVITRFPFTVEEAAERKPVFSRVIREVVGARKPFESTNQSRLFNQ
jgi:hypothetical protein